MGKGRMNQFRIPVRAHTVVIFNFLCRSGGCLCKVVHLHVLLRVGHLEDVGGNLHAGVAVVGHPHAAGLTLLGGNQDDAVSSAYAVYGGSRCILENRQGLYIGGAQEVDVVHEGAVNNVQRIGIIADGAHAADLHGRACARGAALGDLHAAYHALEGAHGVGGNLLGELVTLHVHNGGGEVLGLLGAVAHHHNLVKEVGVLCKDYAGGNCVCGERLGSVAYAAYLNGGLGALYHKEEVSVQARGSAVLGTSFHYGCADNRAQGIFYHTFHLILCKGGEPCKHHGQCY